MRPFARMCACPHVRACAFVHAGRETAAVTYDALSPHVAFLPGRVVGVQFRPQGIEGLSCREGVLPYRGKMENSALSGTSFLL